MMSLLIAVAFLTVLPGCLAEESASTAMVTVSGVPPFTAQARTDDCASVALSSLLAHAGLRIPPAEIDQTIYDPILGGSLLAEMENYAIAQGRVTRSGRGDIEFLRTLISRGTPVLLPIDLGFGRWRRPHYVVVFGYGPDDFLIYQEEARATRVPAEELDRRWARTGRLYLYLTDEK